LLDTPWGNCYTFFIPPLAIGIDIKQVTALKKVGVLYHPMVTATQTKAKEIKNFLDSSGVSAWLCSAWDTKKAKAHLDNTSLVLTVGGDGTILRAAQAVVPGEIPITGINMGKLGFMTELSADEALEKLPALLAGKGWIDQRAVLEVKLKAAGQEPRNFYALNDAVMARGAIARVVHIAVSIDGQNLNTYRADGVVIATATGSTGYSLAAGGPVLHPQSSDYILVPIAPHLSAAYALVLPPTAMAELRITTVYRGTLSIDGHVNLPLSSGDTITVKQGPIKARFLRIYPETYFYSSLEQKLKGKQ
jgi:NAD+ kinase